jgi:hypothetical protein
MVSIRASRPPIEFVFIGYGEYAQYRRKRLRCAFVLAHRAFGVNVIRADMMAKRYYLDAG